MDALGIVDGGKIRYAIERSGSSPKFGRGIFSDEDLCPKNFEQLKRMREWAKEKNYHITENNRFMFKIEEADTVVWKPGAPVPKGDAALMEGALAQSLEQEFALGARPGSKPHPLESNLENMTKGDKGLFKNLPSGYKGEMELIAGAKDVVRSMKAAGMCTGDRARVCQNLEDFRSMRKSPQELGFNNLEDMQTKLRKLMSESFLEAQKQFENEFAELNNRLRKAGSASERELLLRQAVEMKQRAIRMGVRFEVLSELNPDMIKGMSGGKSARAFWSDMSDKIRSLSESAETASGHVTMGRVLNITLNMATFAQCMADEKTAKRAARLKQAQKCTLEAAGGLAFGELVSQGFGYVAFYYPSGAMVAGAGITAAGIAYSSYEVYLAVVAYNEMTAALDEAEAREKALENSQRRNLARFPDRLAAEEEVINDALKEISRLKKGILNDLEVLAGEENELIEKMDLQANSERLKQLLDYLKPAVDACYKNISGGKSVYGDLASAGRLLEQAQRRALTCSDAAELEKAEKEYLSAVKRIEAVRKELAQKPLDAMRRDKIKQSPEFTSLNEAWPILRTLNTRAGRAEIVLKETGKIRGRVKDCNDYIAAQKASLHVRLEAFKAAFPEDFMKMLEANSPRITSMEVNINSLKPMEEGEWYSSWKSIADKDVQLRRLVQYMKENYSRDRRIINDMDDCLVLKMKDSTKEIERLSKYAEDCRNTNSQCEAKLKNRDSAGARAIPASNLPTAPTATPGNTETLYVLADNYPKLFQSKTGGLKVEKTSLVFAGDKHLCPREYAFNFNEPPQALRPGELFSMTITGKLSGQMSSNAVCAHKRAKFYLAKQFLWDSHYRVGGSIAPTALQGDSLIGEKRDDKTMTMIEYAQSKTTVQYKTPENLETFDFGLAVEPDNLVLVHYHYKKTSLPVDKATELLSRRTVPVAAPPAALPAVQADISKPETLAAGLLLLEMITGDVSYYFKEPGDAKPLKKTGKLKTGVTLRTGAGAQAVIKTPANTKLTVGENTKVKIRGPQEQKQVIEVIEGSVESSRSQDIPGSDDLRIRSRDAESFASGTRYKVTVTDKGTRYEVLEGEVKITGAMLTRTDANYEILGKHSFVKELTLKAGDKAIALRIGVDKTTAPSAAAVSPLSRPDPWNDPQIKALMDEWLAKAVPAIAADRPGEWKYTEWGQVLGPGSKAAGEPDHPAGWTRYQSLWPFRAKYGSINLCNMGEFIKRRLSHQNMDDCVKPRRVVPAIPATGGERPACYRSFHTAKADSVNGRDHQTKRSHLRFYRPLGMCINKSVRRQNVPS